MQNFPPFLTLMTQPAAKTIIILTLIGLLAACSGHKPAVTTANTPAVKPKAMAVQKMFHFPSLKPPGQRTVDDIMRSYGPYALTKIKPYFAKAQVTYPPREVTLVALKQEKKLELWARDSGGFRFIRDYKIQAASGVSGPKLRQGDKQVPEGIYRIEGMNPNSHYHMSMKINYPNEFDLFHAWQEGRTNPGSDIFIHGRAVSIGCLAMGDEAIEELFVLTEQVGIGNVKVVIAPHDPRVFPLIYDPNKFPKWIAELYSSISREINALTPTNKLTKIGL